jgi:hypothetical protein
MKVPVRPNAQWTLGGSPREIAEVIFCFHIQPFCILSLALSDV